MSGIADSLNIRGCSNVKELNRGRAMRVGELSRRSPIITTATKDGERAAPLRLQLAAMERECGDVKKLPSIALSTAETSPTWATSGIEAQPVRTRARPQGETRLRGWRRPKSIVFGATAATTGGPSSQSTLWKRVRDLLFGIGIVAVPHSHSVWPALGGRDSISESGDKQFL